MASNRCGRRSFGDRSAGASGFYFDRQWDVFEKSMKLVMPNVSIMQVIINFNNDIGDYMEWSGGGWYLVNLSDDAYKFATNYVVYGLPH